ncbi:hypothetical protein ACQ7B2_19560, partial [Escherichia coli]
MLIEKFNRSVADAKQPDLSVETSLADAAGTLFTGRIWGASAEPPLTMVEFSTPTNGLVHCTSEVVADHAWLA